MGDVIFAHNRPGKCDESTQKRVPTIPVHVVFVACPGGHGPKTNSRAGQCASVLQPRLPDVRQWRILRTCHVHDTTTSHRRSVS